MNVHSDVKIYRVRADSTREHILDATAFVLQRLGLSRATTRVIAEAAGLSESALYRHFVDKTALFLSVIGERMPQLIALLEDLPNLAGQRTVRANLEQVARVAIRFYEQTIPLAGSLFSEPDLLARHQEHMRSKNVGPHRAAEMLALYVRTEQRLGRIDPQVDPEAVAALFIGSMLGRVLLRRLVGDDARPEADERYIRNVIRTMLMGLAPEDRS